jgi:hypothetical protein
MIGYRFLTPAEEEMVKAALFYEQLGMAWVIVCLMTFST